MTTFALSYLSGLYSNLLAYRAFLHPLNRFPGPYMARFGNFYMVVRTARKADLGKQLQALHILYGDVVRVASNTISIAHPDAPTVVHTGNWARTDFFDTQYPITSVSTIRDRTAHVQHKKTWAPAFSDGALRGYEKRMMPFVLKLQRRIEASNGEPIDICKLLSFQAYDIMGDLAFSRSFNQLETGEIHYELGILREGIDKWGMRCEGHLFSRRICRSTDAHSPRLASAHYVCHSRSRRSLQNLVWLLQGVRRTEAGCALLPHCSKYDKPDIV